MQKFMTGYNEILWFEVMLLSFDCLAGTRCKCCPKKKNVLNKEELQLTYPELFQL